MVGRVGVSFHAIQVMSRRGRLSPRLSYKMTSETDYKSRPGRCSWLLTCKSLEANEAVVIYANTLGFA